MRERGQQAARIRRRHAVPRHVLERARQQLEASRVAAERERQQAEAQHSYHTVLYVASAIGGVGLLAMLFTTLFQWRSVSRIAEVTALRLQLPEHARLGFSPDDNGAPSGEAVALSNQRMLSVIRRMEQRISELEHTAEPPLPAASAEPAGETDFPQRAAAADTAQSLEEFAGVRCADGDGPIGGAGEGGGCRR